MGIVSLVNFCIECLLAFMGGVTSYIKTCSVFKLVSLEALYILRDAAICATPTYYSIHIPTL